MDSLFDAAEIWRTDPAKAFDAFVQSPKFLELSRRRSRKAEGTAEKTPSPLRASSARVYIAMFGKFLQWLRERDLPLHAVTSNDLMAFIEHGQVINGTLHAERNSRIRLKYLSLIERVYTHLNIRPNPAQHASFDIFQSGNRQRVGHDADSAVLSEAQQAAFMDALPQAEPGERKDPSHGWKRRRDRAMQALMLGAGLKVAEVVGMYTINIGEKDSTGSVPVTISPGSVGGVVRWHQTQLRPFAVAEVQQWLQERQALKIPGPLLFPATLRGGVLNKATVYRQVKATFSRAGISVPRQGGRTLRNSFAVRELQAGESIELVGEFMGHRRRRSTEHYCTITPEDKPEEKLL